MLKGCFLLQDSHSGRRLGQTVRCTKCSLHQVSYQKSTLVSFNHDLSLTLTKQLQLVAGQKTHKLFGFVANYIHRLHLSFSYADMLVNEGKKERKIREKANKLFIMHQSSPELSSNHKKPNCILCI